MLHRAFSSARRAWALLVLLAGVAGTPAWAADIITTFAGDGTWNSGGDGGPAGQAQLKTPSGVAVDSQGNVYIADTYSHRLRKVSAAGTISTVAGTGIAGYSGDNGAATQARLNGPTSVAVDSAGNLYVADSGNKAVRKISAAGTITTLNISLMDASGTAVKLVYPTAVAVDSAGHLYVADYGAFKVYKYSAAGQTSLVAGNGQSQASGDSGPATQAGLMPGGLALDNAGNLYISDTGNHRIRWVKPDGTIVTAAGTGSDGYSGDNGVSTQARLSGPTGLAWYNNALYIADRGNHRVRRIGADKIIATVAGNGVSGSDGDGKEALQAELSYPNAVALNSSGKLYIADTNNYRIRTLQPGSSATTQVLQVIKSGTGSGTVSAAPGQGSGINCGTLCAENYITSTLVVLTATPVAGSEFTGWAGDCSGTTATLNLVMNSGKRCTANFDLVGGANHTLTVTKNSGGRITSAPAGIDCGVACSAPFAHNSTVTLTAQPDSGYRLAQWGGACSGVSASTSVAMSAAKTCSATFEPLSAGTKTLTVTRVGNGSVTSTPVGIDCGASCTAGFDAGTVVTLVATASADSRFTGWSGECSGTLNPTQVTLDAAKACTANFELLSPGIGKTLTVSNQGSGFITSAPTGISCGSTCSTRFNQGTAITLTATPDADNRFVGWSGDCSGTQASLAFSLDSDRVCAANYEVLPADTYYSLTTNVTGSGTVNSQDGKIACASTGSATGGARCSAEYPALSVALLNAQPATGWSFAGWSGDCAGSNQPASITLDATKICTANFTQGTGTVALSLAKTGSGTGTVSGNGLNCGPSTGSGSGCSGSFPQNTPITLTATPDVGSSFAGWGGDCSGPSTGSGSASLDLTLDRSKTCVASFDLTSQPADSGIINTYAGTGTAGFAGDNGAALQAQLNSPWSVAEIGGTLFVADRDNQVIRRIRNGTISTLAGTPGSAGFGGDGSDAALAKLNNPAGVSVGQNGKLYLADTENHRVRVLDAYANPGTTALDDLATASTLRIDTVAGNGILGFLGDGGQATQASLNYPVSATADSQGNVYIADTSNHRIRKVTAAGVISTFAGTGTPGFGGDNGLATQAGLSSPSGLALSPSAGHLYIADQANYRVRKVDLSTGLITTVVGDGTLGSSGDGGAALQAQLMLPYALAVDRAGNLYIAESAGNRIRKVDGNGVITTVAGTGQSGFSGDGGPAVEARLNTPTGVAVDSSGALFIADKGNHRIRRVGSGSGTAQSHTLSIAKIGGGTGTVTSATAGENGGIDCGSRCSDVYPHNAQITLVATAGADSTFAGWSGACTGTGTQITVIVGSDQTCVASFTGGSGGTGTLSLELSSYNVAENAGSLTIHVVRSGESSGPAAVDYVIQDGTALRGQHYSASNGLLQWAAGESGAKAISILIVDDPVINEHRRFSLGLRNQTGGVALGLSEAMITIVNDDLLPDGIRCPATGTIDTVCNALGMTLSNILVTANGHVANGTLSGTLQNSGWVSNLTLDRMGSLVGGIVTGSIINDGRMSDFEFHGTVLAGGTLAGNITNVTGTFRDVSLAANTVISGGQVAGAIIGTAGAPGTLQSLTVADGASLSHVLIGQNVNFAGAVTLGKGVRFPQGSALPAGADLAQMLPLLTRAACAGGAVQQPSVYDLRQDVYYPSSGILSSVNALPILGALGLSLAQDPQQGYLYATLPSTGSPSTGSGSGSGLRYIVQPLGVAFGLTRNSPMIGGTDRQGVTFVTSSGVEVYAQPALEDLCQLQTLLSARNLALASVQADGNLRITSSDPAVWFSARPEFTSQEVSLLTATGVYAPPSPSVGNTPLAYYVYVDRDGRKRQQILTPAPVDAEALRNLVAGVRYQAGGVVSVTLPAQIARFALDYRVENGTVTGSMGVVQMPDANGDGLADYRLTYPDGSRQVLYRLP